MQKVEFVSENKAGACPGFVGGNGSKAAVIVLQEWWGVNEQIKKQADEWFGKDFTVMCPDLYRGKVAIDHEEAGHLMNGLDWIGAVQDIAGCVKFLKEKKGCAKVGVVGFCMGGALTLASTIKVDGVDAGSVFYGICGKQLADPKDLQKPVQLHFGSKDALAGFSSPKDADALEETLKEIKADYERFSYENAAHAFTHVGGPNFDQESNDLAKQRTIKFFTEKLLK